MKKKRVVLDVKYLQEPDWKSVSQEKPKLHEETVEDTERKSSKPCLLRTNKGHTVGYYTEFKNGKSTWFIGDPVRGYKDISSFRRVEVKEFFEIS